MTTAIIGPVANTPEWEAMRKYDPNRNPPVVIGASEAASACGRSKYCSRLELYLRKRGEYEPVIDDEQRHIMDMGHLLEPVILDMYQRKSGVRLTTQCPMFLSADHPFIGATPDGVPSGVAEFVVDAKSTLSRRYDATGEDMASYGQDGTDQVPIEYLYQAQQQCYVLNVKYVEFPVLFDGRTLRVYRVNRDADLISELIEQEKDLCERIISGNPPEPDFGHPNTMDILQARQRPVDGKVIEWDETQAEKWREKQRLGQMIADLKKRQDAIGAELFASLGDASEAAFGEMRVKRINVKGSEYTVKREPYSFLRESKVKK